MNAAESFLAEIDSYLSLSGMSDTAFGKAAVGDPSFVSDLRAGRSPGLRLVDKVRKYITDSLPSNPSSHPAEVSP